jgi:prophage maintenance system killer protein
MTASENSTPPTGFSEKCKMAKQDKSHGEVVLYHAKKTGVTVEVRTDGGAVWLNRRQLAVLFNRDIKTIGKHINNALREELADLVVVADFATTTPHGAMPGKFQTHRVEHYSIDMILSVGYRVKSAEGVYFRRWANSVLKQHLMQGYTINEHRLKQLNQVIDIVARSSAPEISGVASVLQKFTRGLGLLDDYDHQCLTTPSGKPDQWKLTYDLARTFIDAMTFGGKSDLFGRERGESFKGTIGAIYQTFGKHELYPSVQEKAANLLYLTVKDHSFVDGNKRTAAALFVYFLHQNGALFGAGGLPLIENNTLAAVTLMIALSKPDEKPIMCSLVMNMLDDPQKEIANG